MEKLYRLVVVKFDYLSAKCLFPIIINWGYDLQAKYEEEILTKIINELQSALGISKVHICHNQVGQISLLQSQFNQIIGNIDYNTPTSQLKSLPVDLKRFRDLNEYDYENGILEKFQLFDMSFPVRVIDHSAVVVNEMHSLPMLVIEE